MVIFSSYVKLTEVHQLIEMTPKISKNVKWAGVKHGMCQTKFKKYEVSNYETWKTRFRTIPPS